MSTTVKPWPPMTAGETDFRGIDWKHDLTGTETVTAADFEIPDDSGVTLVGAAEIDSQNPITAGKFAIGSDVTDQSEVVVRAIADVDGGPPDGRRLICEQTLRLLNVSTAA